MRRLASRPSPVVDAKAMSVDIRRVVATSGGEGLTLVLEEFWVGSPKERQQRHEVKDMPPCSNFNDFMFI